MFITIVYFSLGILGLISSIVCAVGFFTFPFALYKGFKHQDWKMTSAACIAFGLGLFLSFIILASYGIVGSILA